MAEEKLLTVREVSILLHISEKEAMDLAENGTIPAYKVGGVYLRFKKDQVLELKKAKRGLHSKHELHENNPITGKLADFFYFNDFYIIAGLIIIVLLVIIFRGY
ncbi:MAG: helix-turn-helix domain-containing protein [Candidatus Omnitrophica bacterium]|nr:helix-turn-helix domain-containing protein [Candidatus Omnitrophota bacterium]MBU1868924.1 helix-turn-helix domain-containing protein [Candidatus Omnitrophota bacterium]